MICGELLGRPTASTIAISLCADRDIEYYIDYGTQSGVYTSSTSIETCAANQPVTLTLVQLSADTRYFYRVVHRAAGATAWVNRLERTFHTARPRHSTFSFAIEADPHLDVATNPVLYKRTLANILEGGNDFLIDLGDTFMTEKIVKPTIDSIRNRDLLLRSCLDTACHSVPLLLVQGNHDGELGWLLDGTANNVAVMSASTRLAYYPNPIPDGFYSGDTSHAPYVGVRQNYFAWEWGDALFVVLDPYWYTVRKPSASKDNWDWTLGRTQYDWFARTLAASTARLKFVFCHQIVGGIDTEGRGGIEGVPYYEMGGRNADSTWGFTAHRPGWPMPIHQLMVANHVSAFFHGHDHVFVKQDLDGIVYQEMPQPGYYNYANPSRSYSNISQAAGYGYVHGTVLPSSGYLRVTVSDTGAIAEYVRTYLPAHENNQQHNKDVACSYTLGTATSTAVEAASHSPAHAPALDQNYPNPFNPATTIVYTLPERAVVTLTVHNMLGKEAARLVHGTEGAGSHSVQWNAANLPSGVYRCTLTAGNASTSRTMMLIK